MLQTLKDRWNSYKGDGCTSVPDLWMKRACLRHDRHYTFHTHRDGTPITRLGADWEFFKDGVKDAPLKITGTVVSFIYFVGVRLGGASYWEIE